MAGMFEDYVGRVKGRFADPLGTLATALKEGMPTKENPLGMFGFGGLVKGQLIGRGTKVAPNLDIVSRRFEQPGPEFGVHVSTNPEVPELMQYNYRTGAKGGIIEGKSGVEKPLVLPDTGGRWEPNIVYNSILTEAQKGTIKFPEQRLKELDSIVKQHASADIDTNTAAKKMQEIIKKAGYDHISYINMREGAPSESAILFDKEQFVNPFYKNPLGDTTK